MSHMTSKERVLRAIRREETDRVPVDVELTYEMRDILIAHFDCTEEQLFEMFGRDFRRVSCKYVGPQRYAPDGEPADPFGVASGGPTYADDLGYRPLAEADTVACVEAHEWPDPDWWDYGEIEQECDRYRDFAVTGGNWAPFFCQACNMVGIGRFLEMMLEAPDVAESILTHITDHFVSSSRRYFDAANGKIDIFFVGDDYGGKNGLLMSPDMWRRLIKPQLVRLYTLADEYDLLMMQHSCGSIRPVIGDMIELGLDVLDPVQIAAADMEPEGLKRDFGADLTFHGGVNTESTLPFGTPDEVYEETRHLMSVLGDGGGYVVCGSQYLQSDIPIDNVIAMYRAAGSCDPGRL